jgi:pilus assembly protein CpaC
MKFQKKQAAFLLGLMLCALPLRGAPPEAEEPPTLRIPVGHQQVLEAGDLLRASIANPRIADAAKTDDEQSLLITALSPGTTELHLWKRDGSTQTYQIKVLAYDPERFAEELRLLLDGIEGIQVKVIRDRVVLDGKTLTQQDQERLERIASAYPEVLNLVSLDLSAHNRLIAERIREQIGFSEVQVEMAGAKAILRGTVFREEDRQKAREVAQAFTKEVVDFLEVREPMVEIDVKFIQVSRRKLRETGHNILKGLSGGVGLAGSTQQPEFTLSGEATAALRNLVSTGEARVLAEPFLATVGGKEASFHSGGERGYRVAGTGAADVKFKKYGLLLSILPQVYGNGQIKTRVDIEVSMPVADASSPDMAFQTFQTGSELIGREGETIVISGLQQSLRNNFREKTPLLGDIPILKVFFSERREEQADEELLLTVTPRVPLIRKSEEAAASRRTFEKTAEPPTGHK